MGQPQKWVGQEQVNHRCGKGTGAALHMNKFEVEVFAAETLPNQGLIALEGTVIKLPEQSAQFVYRLGQSIQSMYSINIVDNRLMALY